MNIFFQVLGGLLFLFTSTLLAMWLAHMSTNFEDTPSMVQETIGRTVVLILAIVVFIGGLFLVVNQIK